MDRGRAPNGIGHLMILRYVSTRWRKSSPSFIPSLHDKTFYLPPHAWGAILTRWGLVTPYGDIDLGHHWLRQWLVAWQHQAITWTNVDLSSVKFCGIHLTMILLVALKVSVHEIISKITATSPRGQWLSNSLRPGDTCALGSWVGHLWFSQSIIDLLSVWHICFNNYSSSTRSYRYFFHILMF